MRARVSVCGLCLCVGCESLFVLGLLTKVPVSKAPECLHKETPTTSGPTTQIYRKHPAISSLPLLEVYLPHFNFICTNQCKFVYASTPMKLHLRKPAQACPCKFPFCGFAFEILLVTCTTTSHLSASLVQVARDFHLCMLTCAKIGKYCQKNPCAQRFRRAINFTCTKVRLPMQAARL